MDAAMVTVLSVGENLLLREQHASLVFIFQ